MPGRRPEPAGTRSNVGARIGVTLTLPDTLAILGLALSLIGEPEQAARMFGAVEALRERLGDLLIVSSRRDMYEQASARIVAGIGDAAMAEAWQEGRTAPLDDVITDSLAPFAEIARPLDRGRRSHRMTYDL